jgi:ankyrin repeat protein
MKNLLGLGALMLGALSASVAASPLTEAVRGDDHAAVKRLLAGGANPNAPEPDKSTALSWAVDRQDEDTVKMLLAAGAKPNSRDVTGASPLTVACELGNPAIVTRLLDAGATAGSTRADGIAALALCAGTSSPEALAKLVARGANVNAADPGGQTALMWAAAKGRTDNIAFLLKHGAKVNAVTRSGFTPLYFALQSRVPTASIALLDAGADSKAVLPDGTTVIAAALLVDDVPFAMQVVARGADVNARDRDGRQLIHVAAANGNADLVKLILAKGADPNAMTTPPAPATPVIVAAAAPVGEPVSVGGDAPKRKKLLEAADFLVPPPVAPTAPLLLAAHAGSVPAMKALIDAGAKANLKAGDGVTLSLAAAGSGNLEAVKYALTIDPNIAAVAQGGKSIMHMVINNRTGAENEEIVTYLADQGAVLNVRDDRGTTPGDLANRIGPERIRVFYIQLLKDRGVVTSKAH